MTGPEFEKRADDLLRRLNQNAQDSAPSKKPARDRAKEVKEGIQGLAVLVIIVVVAIAWFTHSGDKKKPASGSGTTTHTIGRYEQTWGTSYGKTTCEQWLDEMSSRERFVAAHDFLIALNAYDQSDHFAHEFAGDISQDCQPAPQLKVSEVAAAFATIDTNDFPR